MTRKRYEPNPHWLADGLRLLQAIRLAGMLQRDFATAMGVGKDVVSRWTRGQMSFRDHFVRRKAVTVLGCTMAQLDGDDPFPRHQRKKEIDYALSHAASAEALAARLTAELELTGYAAHGGSYPTAVQVHEADEAAQTSSA